jgi:hypothetical protein
MDTSPDYRPSTSPVPPTPLSSSPKSPTASILLEPEPSTVSIKMSTPLYSPARETPTSAAIIILQPGNSPDAYTPVHKEDSNIFSSHYVQLIGARMEQDRERQRRKEDNSGFIPVSDRTDAEIEDFAGSNAVYGTSLFEQMKAEARARNAALQNA